VLTGRRYRLELTPDQAAYAERIGAACRDVWNTGLEQRRIYRQRGAWMNYVPQAREMAAAKKDFPWLAEAPSCALQQTLMDLDKACRAHGTFAVHWRSKNRWKPSFRFPDAPHIHVERLNKRWGRVTLTRFGWVRFRWTRALGGEIRSATVSFKAGHWYVSFLVEDGEIAVERHALPDAAVGIDRGVKVAVATSDGEFYDQPFTSLGQRKRHVRLQRQLARTKRGSSNRKKTVRLLARSHARPASRRADFCAQTAHALTQRYAAVILEDLKTKSMTASAAGTIEAPGSKVRQKSGLNRAILDKGWYQFETALHSASRYTGTEVKKVPAAYTSQTCNVCRRVDANSRESQAKFACTACGHTEHADVNAAKNILAAGLAVTACGDLGVSRSMKQEPAPLRGVAHQLETVGIPRL
jgi:putative transposase